MREYIPICKIGPQKRLGARCGLASNCLQPRLEVKVREERSRMTKTKW